MSGNIIRTIDSGGTATTRADVDARHRVDNIVTIKTPTSFKGFVDFVTADLPAHTIALSLAIAGVIENNTIVESPNIPMLRGINLAEAVRLVRKLPVAVFNDMQAATRGVMYFTPEAKNGVVVTWSSGVGARYIINGHVTDIPREAGHLQLDTSDLAPLCGCGKQGHAEAFLGGLRIRERIVAEAKIKGFQIPPTIDPCAFLDDEFDKGNPWARTLYKSLARKMGQLLGILQTIHPSKVIVMRGTFGLHALERPKIGDDIRAGMKGVINERWVSEYEVPILLTPSSTDALVGAALCLRESGILR